MNDAGPRPPQTSRDAVRTRLVEVAAQLLAAEGPDAVTTRSVALAAGVQAPTIYRLFGDKDGLLQAVAEHGYAVYTARKPPVDADDDPVRGLRAGWDLHIGFGLVNPALFRLMHTMAPGPDGRSAADAGVRILRQRVARVARAGRLKVPERRAVDLIRAAGTGVVLTLIDQPEADRDTTLSDLAWEAVRAAVLADPQELALSVPATAAVTLRAALPAIEGFTPHESALFGDWLERVAGT
ncbi:TetR/AcrR family transcriptional regulator [Kitasatospora sp. YST-16]|uniref:TetR/AcrR family transcriptional regulator n=1 Tax=Kitasatospora sp. YST-16 TaxID=2998080 RepID=UPI0022849FD9|nr:TetR/AcrR family transcriptional regulator [Kitasatospora sp. YST-16]WAL70664.1 TetR/AcrR family transcriptional regulator [Kitasatospora sp. YST-16]WNW36706.1 TetR/AcrR family transcriptional regulator [Streptomyces sp. Li-HN-5-13]